RAVRARPVEATAGSSTVPPLAAVTISTRLASPALNRSASSRSACDDWAAGSVNPPLFTAPNTPPPKSPATTSSRAVAASTAHPPSDDDAARLYAEILDAEQRLDALRDALTLLAAARPT